MKIATIALGVVTILLALTLKFFTYEYYFEDDATTGIALRWTPALENRQVLEDAKAVTLMQDENAFIGEGLYRIFVSWGWLVLLLLGVVLIVASIRRRKRPTRQ